MSVVIGYLGGIIGSLILKQTRNIVVTAKKSNPIEETLILVIMGIIPYNVAEKFGYNGPCAIVIYGITIKSYGWLNLSPKGIISSS